MSHQRSARPLVDAETGEVVHVAFPRVRRHHEPFTLLFGGSMLALLRSEGRTDAEDKPMRPVDWQLLLYVVASAEYENRLERYVTEIAKDLGKDRSTISKALQSLEARELVYVEPRRPGRPLAVHLHPALAFRGKAGQRAAVLNEHWSDLPLPGPLRRSPLAS
jgi:DNA-binding transcriptional ArsR family regulator